jgi:hypothetical protein
MLKKIIAILVTICLYGCTTMGSLPATPEQITKSVKVGDVVNVKQKNGWEEKFKVTSIKNNTLYGAHDKVPFNQIQTLQKQQVSTGKTVLLSAGIAGGVVILYLTLMGAAFMLALTQII